MSGDGYNLDKTIKFAGMRDKSWAVILSNPGYQVVTGARFAILSSLFENSVTHGAFISNNTFIKISFRVHPSAVTVDLSDRPCAGARGSIR